MYNRLKSSYKKKKRTLLHSFLNSITAQAGQEGIFGHGNQPFKVTNIMSCWLGCNCVSKIDSHGAVGWKNQVLETSDITDGHMNFYFCTKISQLLSINTTDGDVHYITLFTEDEHILCLYNCTERNRWLVLLVARESETSTVNNYNHINSCPIQHIVIFVMPPKTILISISKNSVFEAE